MDDDCRGDTMAKPKSTRKSADKTAAKPGPKSADRTAARPARRERYGITWLAMYRFSDPAWFTSRAATEHPALASTGRHRLPGGLDRAARLAGHGVLAEMVDLVPPR